MDRFSIIIIGSITGIQRPNKVPEHVTAKKEKKHYYYIRYASNSVLANPEQERELINMINYAPLDARPNFDTTENDISIALLIRLDRWNSSIFLICLKENQQVFQPFRKNCGTMIRPKQGFLRMMTDGL